MSGRGLVASCVLLLVSLPWLASAAEEVAPGCACGPFDKPDRVIREGSIDFKQEHRVVGTEIYLANTSLRAGQADAPFVVVGGDPEGAGRLQFRARTTITLGPGFHAERGSRFEASIEPLKLARAAKSVWPDDTKQANEFSGATDTVVVPVANPVPPDPYAITPMRPPRRTPEGTR